MCAASSSRVANTTPGAVVDLKPSDGPAASRDAE
eukprot:CAMPEP_0196735038 /NCGR_PEP_ID=MMETSP1091-20130531/13610_1 /TAXON_ID=302021 /ORGANISM="Rhodomonas sp., Strain CCMP768" /LENGTH=33 /DNA_ID= /DNA_START= /DNA_END= /DNA_ORIENTATION=